MAFKVNYGLERAERNRAKQAKKEAKLKARTVTADDAASYETTGDGGTQTGDTVTVSEDK